MICNHNCNCNIMILEVCTILRSHRSYILNYTILLQYHNFESIFIYNGDHISQFKTLYTRQIHNVNL